jgi:hypothetical protein
MRFRGEKKKEIDKQLLGLLCCNLLFLRNLTIELIDIFLEFLINLVSAE